MRIDSKRERQWERERQRERKKERMCEVGVNNIIEADDCGCREDKPKTYQTEYTLIFDGLYSWQNGLYK